MSIARNESEVGSYGVKTYLFWRVPPYCQLGGPEVSKTGRVFIFEGQRVQEEYLCRATGK
jgi:hypothetical protein